MKKNLIVLSLLASFFTTAVAQRPDLRPLVGITLNSGVGLSDFETGIITKDNQKVRLSTGGGYAIGLTGIVPVSGLWCMSGELNYQMTSLQPKLTNADGGFYHVNFIPGVQRLLPVGRKVNYVSAGVGAVFSMNPKLEVNASEIPDGFDYAFVYDSAVGAAFTSNFILGAPGRRIGGMFGLRFTYLKHHANKLKINGVEYGINEDAHHILPDDLDEPDGSGVDLVMSLTYRL